MITSDTETTIKTMPMYKYQACPGDDQEKMGWVRQILVEHQLFFASRRCFNDPLDCVVPTFLQTPATILKRFVEKLVDRHFPNADEAEKFGMILKGMSVNALKDVRENLKTT